MGVMSALSDARSKERIADLEAVKQRYEDLLDTNSETTRLGPDEERDFAAWSRANGVRDVDHPDSHYDYRGFWKESGGRPVRGGVDHFPDAFKQHGHPTFSRESRYSRGAGDGGIWLDDSFVPPPKYESAAYPTPRAPDTTALDEAFRRPGQYSYFYKDPGAPGAAPGEQVGPMAHELRGIPGVVHTSPDGFDRVDNGRLGLATASQVGKLTRDRDSQRQELDGLRQRLADLSDEGDSEGVLRAGLGER